MPLQISTSEHESSRRPGLWIGSVKVTGEGVYAEFFFGGAFGATREEAERHAQIFVDAMFAQQAIAAEIIGAGVEADFMKAVYA